MPEGLYLLNPPAEGRRTDRGKLHRPRLYAVGSKRWVRSEKSQSRRAGVAINKKRRHHKRTHKMSAPQRKYFGRRDNPVNKKRRHHRNPSTAVLYGIAGGNPKKRRHARRHTGGGSRGLLGGLGDFQKLLRPEFLMQALGAGTGLLAAIVIPNWLFNSYAWYQGWTKQGVRAATGMLAFPLVTRMLPPALHTGFASGVLAAVGVGGLAELLGKPLIVGPGASDVAATPQTLFAGLGAPIQKMTAGQFMGPLGAPIEKGLTRSSFAGTASELGMTIVPTGTGADLVSQMYDKNRTLGF